MGKLLNAWIILAFVTIFIATLLGSQEIIQDYTVGEIFYCEGYNGLDSKMINNCSEEFIYNESYSHLFQETNVTTQGYDWNKSEELFEMISLIHPSYLIAAEKIVFINATGLRVKKGNYFWRASEAIYSPFNKEIRIYSGGHSYIAICHELAHLILKDETELQHSLIYLMGETEFCLEEPEYLSRKIQ